MSDLKKAASELRDVATWLNQVADEFEKHAEYLTLRDRQFDTMRPIFEAMSAAMQPPPAIRTIPAAPVKEAESRSRPGAPVGRPLIPAGR